MTICLRFVLLAALLVADAAAAGQDESGAPSRVQPQGVAVDTERLPVSLDRIKRMLAQERRSSNSDGLRLDFYVEVHGRAPKIDVFRDFDLVHGPVPFGAPTHAEVLQLVTPQEFRAPSADLMTPVAAILRWLTGRDRP